MLVANPTQAEVKLSDNMPADTYDILLVRLDDGNVLYKWPEPFVVTPTPVMEHPDCGRIGFRGAPCAGGESAVQGETEYIDITGKDFESFMQAHFERYLSVPYTEVYESPEPIRTYGSAAGALTSTNARIKLPELLPGTYTLVLVKPGELRSGGEQRELLRVQGFLTVRPHPGQRTARITVQFVVRPELQLEMSQGDTDTAVLETGSSEDYDPVFQMDVSDTVRVQSFLQHLPSEAVGRVLTVLEELGVASGLSSGTRGDAGAEAAPTTEYDLWHTVGAVVLVLGVVSTEWVLRRQWGLR